MTKEELTESFNTWWKEEGRFMTPPSNDWDETKRVMSIAWLNGAHIEATNNT